MAQYNLSWCYENGQGIEKDLEKSIYWYKLSIEEENNYNHFHL
jgi:TPR repeat protein